MLCGFVHLCVTSSWLTGERWERERERVSLKQNRGWSYFLLAVLWSFTWWGATGERLGAQQVRNELKRAVVMFGMPAISSSTPSALVSGCVGSMSWPSNKWACWGILLHTPTAAPKKNPTKIDRLHFKSHESKGGLSQKKLVCSSIICSLPREPQASDHVIVSLGRSDCEFVKLVTSTCAIYIPSTALFLATLHLRMRPYTFFMNLFQFFPDIFGLDFNNFSH